MAHIGRKFVGVHKSQGSAIAEEAIKRTAKLYGIEKDAPGANPRIKDGWRDKASQNRCLMISKYGCIPG